MELYNPKDRGYRTIFELLRVSLIVAIATICLIAYGSFTFMGKVIERLDI